MEYDERLSLIGRELLEGDVGQFPQFLHSKGDLRRASAALRGRLVLDEASRDSTLRTFEVANAWRASHAFPMRSVRASLAAHTRAAGAGGFTAARLKRLHSVREKLRAQPGMGLHGMNDIAGCRVVLPGLRELEAVRASFEGRTPHTVRRAYEYIEAPKPDGYRGIHLVLAFAGAGDQAAFDGRRVEVQLRTQMQHAWSTSVEAVGLFRGEDMKHGAGSGDWLRLFQLMSAEIAAFEGAPLPDGMPESTIRAAEIAELTSALSALDTLEKVRDLTRWIDSETPGRGAGAEAGRWFLITYDSATREVSVDRFSDQTMWPAQLRELETAIETNDDDTRKSVLVEVDEIGKLAGAYPNYFGDVSLFIDVLSRVARGEPASQWKQALRVRRAPPAEPSGDPGWLRRAGRFPAPDARIGRRRD